MARCLICDMEKLPLRGDPCKLCGMPSWDPAYYRGFPFCCEKCLNHFKTIMESCSSNESREVARRGVVI